MDSYGIRGMSYIKESTNTTYNIVMQTMNYKKNDLSLYIPLYKHDTYADNTAEQMQLVEARFVIAIKSISFNYLIGKG